VIDGVIIQREQNVPVTPEIGEPYLATLCRHSHADGRRWAVAIDQRIMTNQKMWRSYEQSEIDRRLKPK